MNVRMVLQDAVAQASSPLPLDRLRCVVSLDAALERAVFFAAHHRGLVVRERATTADLMTQLSAELGAAWKFTGRQELTRLHSARNKAQHEGLYPAQEHMAGFVAAASQAVHTLIQTVTGLDLDRVVLADAVGDEEVRRALQEASRLIETRARPAAAVLACAEAFDMARAKWADQRRSAGLTLPSPPQFSGDLREFRGIADHARQLASQLQDAADSSAFSVDPGELVWFQHLVSDARATEAVISEAEAARSLTFVFEWVLRWERLAGTLLPDRAERAFKAQRRVRSRADSPAFVAETRITASRHGVEVEFILQDVPDEADFDVWRNALGRALSERRLVDGGLHRWAADEAGSVMLTVYPTDPPVRGVRHQIPVDLDKPPDRMVDPSVLEDCSALLRETLSQLEGRIRAESQSRAAAQQAALDARSRFEESVRGRLPAWVCTLQLDDGKDWGTMAGAGLLLTTNLDLPDLRVAEILREAEDVAQCYPGIEGIHYFPAAYATDPVAPLLAVSERIEAAVQATKDVESMLDARRADYEAAVDRGLRLDRGWLDEGS